METSRLNYTKSKAIKQDENEYICVMQIKISNLIYSFTYRTCQTGSNFNVN